ncbi:uncharacterized protein LOC124814956 [Hydra vulgaris]|uniref:uncharacterized protein LOC124814956 n=1 Tax=Hydra vulgaris TaxID=6087 RepID=UPI001F5FB153|nr:uncharacterized protein LOC124814956 [Hydra vulgaris]
MIVEDSRKTIGKKNIFQYSMMLNETQYSMKFMFSKNIQNEFKNVLFNVCHASERLLNGSALSSISGLSLSNENYKIALDILKERYENKQNMISSHMRKLLSFERVHSLNRIEKLRHSLDNIEIQIRSLETLKITSEMYGCNSTDCKKSIIERVIDKNKFEIVHYLPYQPVLRNNKVTSNVRIVFNASSSVDGPSLNDCLYPGPSLTTSLYGILLRFRAQKIAFVADIEETFLQITLSPEDRDCVRFLWFENINSLNKDNIFTQKIIPYRICRVLFGVTSSSFLFFATLITHAEKYLSDDPIFVIKLMNSLHVDDLNSGADSIDSAINFYQKCQDRLNADRLKLALLLENLTKFYLL